MIKRKNILKRIAILIFVFLFIFSLNIYSRHIKVEAAITVYSQTDSRWGNHPYGYSNAAGTQQASISSGGCGILSLVNAIYYLNGQFIDPITLADYSVKYGYRQNGVGTSWGLYKSFADNRGANYGFKYVGTSSSYSALATQLSNGNVAIISIPGHLMACVAYNSSNSTYLILDSYKSSNRGTYTNGYAWKSQSQLQNLGMSTTAYILGRSGSVPTNPPTVADNCSTDYAGDYIISTSNFPLTMRSGHGSNYASVGEIPKGTTVHVTKADGSWAHVEWNGKSGYCSMQYLTKKSSEKKPDNPTINKNQNWYDLKDKVIITAKAYNAEKYYISIHKDGKMIYDETNTSGVFSHDASRYGLGDYAAHVSCFNSQGSIDTQWINYSVVGAATYTDIQASNWWYDLSDEVNISVSTICAKGQVIGIDKEGVGRVVTENTESTYKIPASKLGIGEYSAYFSVYNGSGSIDTKRVQFAIVNSPKPNAEVKTKKQSYTLQDEVEISVLVYCSKNQLIGIDKEGVGRVVTENAKNALYKIPASKLGKGKYSAYFSVWNESGGYDTERISFAIDNKLTNAQIYLAKNKYELSEKITIIATAEGGPDIHHVKIYNDTNQCIVEQDFTGHEFNIDSSKLGKGKYKAKIIAKNCAFSVESEIVDFEIQEGHTYKLMEEISPTCTENGIKKYSCDVCQNSYEEKIAAKGHGEIVVRNIKKASEDEEGYTGDNYCKDCGQKIKSGSSIPKVHKHSYTSKVTKNATCTATGVKTYSCACGNSYTETIQAVGHKWNTQKTVDQKATCTGPGSKSTHCTVCGSIQDGSKEVISALGHPETEIRNAKEATQESTGYTGDIYCKICGSKLETGKEISKLAPLHKHEYSDELITKKATCTEEGIILYTCKCGSNYIEKIKPKGHIWREKATIDVKASCTTNGFKAIHCMICGEIKAGSKEVLSAKGHGQTEIRNQKEATESAEGYTGDTYCKECGQKIKLGSSIPKVHKHSYTSKVTKEATCIEKGVKTFSCKCGEKYTQDIPKKEHQWNSGSITKKATCMTDGAKTYSCISCGITKEETIKATGKHTYGAWDVTKPATVLENGSRVRSCTQCGNKETEEIEKIISTIILPELPNKTLILKVKQSTTGLKVTGMMKGDYVKSWKSSNTKIVTVSGKSNGTSTVKSGSKTGTATITIMLASGRVEVIAVKVQKTTVKTVKLNEVPVSVEVKKGKSLTLKPVRVPFTSQEKVTYKSSSTKIATVSSSGKITGKKAGTTFVTVKSGKKSYKVKVTVK